MQQLMNIYKPIGKTPLEMIHLVREAYPEIKHKQIGYAGRLDPMAHGVLLLMIGEATKLRHNYLSLKKSYTFEVLYGISTDTYDTLGLLKGKQYGNTPSNVNLIVNSFVNGRIGTWKQKYPPFSSKTVNGKPLFWWAKSNLLHTILIPEHEVTIDTFTLDAYASIEASVLHDRIINQIRSVKGNFRQDETIAAWEKFFRDNAVTQFLTAKFSIACSSGTYIRGIAQEMGKALGCGAVTLDILRTSVGDFDLKDAVRLTR